MKIAVIYGGRSVEHEVSCASAASIISHLDPRKYTVTPIKIGKDGAWPLHTLKGFDLVFPALHGPFGEDGTIQSLLELAGVPYVGNGVLASAAGMDKEFTKKLLAADGLRVAEGVVVRPGDRVEPMSLPVFVKPARAGSSVGVTKVSNWDDLPAAVAKARLADPKVIIERAVPGREIDIGVLEYPDGRVVAGPPLEIFSTHEFFNHEAKYQDGSTVFQIPAQLDPLTTSLLQEQAIAAFHALGCRGLLRVDFFLTDEGTPVVNEVNTFPGFTFASQFPRMWQAAGLDYPALLDVLIETAMTQKTGQAAVARHRAAMPSAVG